MDFCFVLGLKKIQFQSGKNYSEKNHSVVLSANETAQCNQLKNKTNTVKHRCEGSNCRVAICLKKNS